MEVLIQRQDTKEFLLQENFEDQETWWGSYQKSSYGLTNSFKLNELPPEVEEVINLGIRVELIPKTVEYM